MKTWIMNLLLAGMFLIGTAGASFAAELMDGHHEPLPTEESDLDSVGNDRTFTLPGGKLVDFMGGHGAPSTDEDTEIWATDGGSR